MLRPCWNARPFAERKTAHASSLSGRAKTSIADNLVTSESIWAGDRLCSGGRTGPQSTPMSDMTAFEAGKNPNDASVLTISVASSWAARAAAISPASNARTSFR